MLRSEKLVARNICVIENSRKQKFLHKKRETKFAGWNFRLDTFFPRNFFPPNFFPRYEFPPNQIPT